MKKACFFMLCICLISGQAPAQSSKFDTVAVTILDRMSAMMGELTSVSATVKTNYDVPNEALGLVKHSNTHHVYIGGPDKMLIRSEGDKGNKAMYYNGKTLTHYSMDKNHYSRVKVPGTVVEMFDYMNTNYGIEFPMADYFYPNFVDDILKDADNLVFLGMTKVDGKECYHIAGVTKNKTFQFWIEDDAFSLPVKLVIVYTSKPLNPQFEATYCDWQINPMLPAGMFDFTAPPLAQKVKMVSKTAKK